MTRAADLMFDCFGKHGGDFGEAFCLTLRSMQAFTLILYSAGKRRAVENLRHERRTDRGASERDNSARYCRLFDITMLPNHRRREQTQRCPRLSVWSAGRDRAREVAELLDA